MSSKTLLSAAALAAAISAASAVSAMPVSGAFSGHVDASKAQPTGGATALRMALRLAPTGAGIGPRTPFDGATIEIGGALALGKGSGPATGTLTFTTPAGTMRGAYIGRMAPDAQGRVTAKARFRALTGTGSFADMKGGGTFSLVFTSTSDVSGRWIGNFKTSPTRTAGR